VDRRRRLYREVESGPRNDSRTFLVRIYGTVTGEKLSVPEVRVDYIRVWPWRTFNFMDLTGNDHTNPRWRKVSKVSGMNVYSPIRMTIITSICWRSGGFWIESAPE